MAVNAFVSIRVGSLLVRQHVKDLQDAMVRVKPAVKSTLAPLEKLHLTLMVLRLNNQQEEQRAKEILGEVIERLKGDKCEAFQLQFSGVGHFGNNVVFAKVKDGPAKDKLYHIADIVRESFTKGGFPSPDTRPLKAHLTVAKCGRGHRNIEMPVAACAEFSEKALGEQLVESLELLSMTRPPDQEGYYFCFREASFCEK